MKQHLVFMKEVEEALSVPAQTERYLAEKTQTKSDLNSMAKRDALQGNNSAMGTFTFTIEGSDAIPGNNSIMETFQEQEPEE